MNGNYAPLTNRIKAAVIDSVVMIALMYAFTEIFRQFDDVSGNIRMFAFIFVFVLCDPIFTSAFGATIGHSYSKITVKRDSNSKKNISFPSAVLRFILKSSLGWLSLLTVTGNDKKQAIHDHVAKSVVLIES